MSSVAWNLKDYCVLSNWYVYWTTWIQFTTSHHISLRTTVIMLRYVCVITNLMHYLSLCLFRQSASTCFRHICSPSSGGILCIYIYIYIYIYSTYQLMCVCIYIYIIPPDDGLQICPKHVEVDWWNKLRIKSASSWFLLHSYIDVHSQQNIFKKMLGTLTE
jgi:hypothetical protein